MAEEGSAQGAPDGAAEPQGEGARQQAEGAQAEPQGTDWKAQARKWEARAKKSEADAKAYQALKAQSKSVEERLAEIERRNAKLEADAERAATVRRVAKATGATVDFVSRVGGSDEDEIAENVKALMQAVAPKGGAPRLQGIGPFPKGAAGSKRTARDSFDEFFDKSLAGGSGR